MYNKEKLLANGDKWEPELAAAARAGNASPPRSIGNTNTWDPRCTLSVNGSGKLNHDCTYVYGTFFKCR